MLRCVCCISCKVCYGTSCHCRFLRSKVKSRGGTKSPLFALVFAGLHLDVRPGYTRCCFVPPICRSTHNSGICFHPSCCKYWTTHTQQTPPGTIEHEKCTPVCEWAGNWDFLCASTRWLCVNHFGADWLQACQTEVCFYSQEVICVCVYLWQISEISSELIKMKLLLNNAPKRNTRINCLLFTLAQELTLWFVLIMPFYLRTPSWASGDVIYATLIFCNVASAVNFPCPKVLCWF